MRRLLVKQSLFTAAVALLVLLAAQPVWAGREAAFVDPRASASKKDGETSGAIIVEPRDDIDLGENVSGIVRRVTLFFVNVSAAPVAVTNVSITGDGDIKTSLVDDECTPSGKIDVGGRCLVTVEVVPGSPGGWSADLMMVHKGNGQVAHAHIHGKVSGNSSAERRETGLLLSTKDAKPIDFGNINTEDGKVTRSILMVNDSAEPITLVSIDLIAAENGLEMMSQGCQKGLELKPGESCPITLLWNPTSRGIIATDLIIRHTGKIGFAVIPVRGVAKGGDSKGASSAVQGKNALAADAPAANAKGVPMPTANDLESIIGKMPKVSNDALGGASGGSSDLWHFIGSVGGRAIIQKPDGSVVVVMQGDEIMNDAGSHARLLEVSGRRAVLQIGKKKKTLLLEASKDLVAKALQAKEDDTSSKDKNVSGKSSKAGYAPSAVSGRRTGTKDNLGGNPSKAKVSLDDLLKGTGAP